MDKLKIEKTCICVLLLCYEANSIINGIRSNQGVDYLLKFYEILKKCETTTVTTGKRKLSRFES